MFVPPDTEKQPRAPTTFTRYDALNTHNQRVHLTSLYAAGLLGVPHFDLLYKIEGLHDHKGGLEVTWRDMPTPAEKWALAMAWEIEGNEDCRNITHEFSDSLLAESHSGTHDRNSTVE